MRVLFLCKGNICRSPAAEFYLKSMRPDWYIDSMATTSNTYGQVAHTDMVRCCLDHGIDTAYYYRDVKFMLDYCDPCELPWQYDLVYDLHLFGISDPYLTGDFNQSLHEIMDFVDNEILNKQER